jgi:hypothetical protein
MPAGDLATVRTTGSHEALEPSVFTEAERSGGAHEAAQVDDSRQGVSS